MYQTSLKQFLGLFDNSVTKSKPTHIVPKRLENIIDYLTRAVWHYTSRGLYEQHKFLFTLLLALKIDMQRGNVSHAEFLYLLKGGASLDLNSVKPKPYRWMLDVIWLNLVEMSKIDVFSVLLEKVKIAHIYTEMTKESTQTLTNFLSASEKILLCCILLVSILMFTGHTE